MKLATAAHDFLKTYRDAQKHTTAHTYENVLDMFLRLADQNANVSAFKPDMVKQYFAECANGTPGRPKKNEKGTLLKKKAVIRGFAKYCLDNRLVEEDPIRGALPNVQRRKILQKPFHLQERKRLRDLPLDGIEAVLFSVMDATGGRLTEVCSIRVRDIEFSHLDPETGKMTIEIEDEILEGFGGKIEVTGKGDAERVVPFMENTAVLLREHIKDLAPDAYVFPHPYIRGASWSPAMVRRRVREWCKQVGVKGQHNPHRFRHTTATELYESGTPLEVIQQWLGHAMITTTQGYAKVANRTVWVAAARRYERVQRGPAFRVKAAETAIEEGAIPST